MYSDEMLSESISSTKDQKIILKIYRDGCKKCAIIDPIFSQLPERFSSSNFQFLQANIADVPKYIESLKFRLLGPRRSAAPSSGSGSAASSSDSCRTCADSGFVRCSECGGEGMLNKGPFGILCNVCCGAKKLRCPSCGGKCVKCE
jgi:hypothetical protein